MSEDPNKEDDFSFDDIPILGEDNSKEAFSFEDFALDKGKESNKKTEHQIVGLGDTHGTIANSALDKWAKQAKKNKKRRLAYKKIGALLFIIALIGGGVVYLFSGGDEEGAVETPKNVKHVKKRGKKRSKGAKDKGENKQAAEDKGNVGVNKSEVDDKKSSSDAKQTTVAKVKGDVGKEGEDATVADDGSKSTEVVKKLPPKKKTKKEFIVALKKAVAPVVVLLDEKIKKGERTKEEKLKAREEAIANISIAALNAYPDDFDFAMTVFNVLQKGVERPLLIDTCKELQYLVKRKDIGAYLYAKCFGISPFAIEPLKRAIRLNSKFKPAYLALGFLYERQRNFNSAKNVYRLYLREDPKDIAVAYQLAKVSLYNASPTKEDKILNWFKNLLESQELPNSTIGYRLFPLAMQAGKKELAQECLLSMDQDSSLDSKHKEYSIWFKMVYGGLSDDDFGAFYSVEIRPYYILYLLIRHREREITLLPTPKNLYPDFWKVFLAWRNNEPGWEKLSEGLYLKYRGAEDKTPALCASLWLQRITPKKMLSLKIFSPVDKEPLLYFMVAEYFRKQGKSKRALIYYMKGKKVKAGIYQKLIDVRLSER